MQNIWVFKIISGDEIVAKAKYDETNSGWLIEAPLVFHIIPDPQGNHRAGLIPYFMADRNASCTFKDIHVVSFIPASPELESAYVKQTTGLDIPAAGKIITN